MMGCFDLSRGLWVYLRTVYNMYTVDGMWRFRAADMMRLMSDEVRN